MKQKYYKRGFLNKKEGMAAFEADITTYEHQSHGVKEVHFDASFNITDCNRKVSLDFCAFGKKNAKERLAKLETLIQQLCDFRDVLEEAYVGN